MQEKMLEFAGKVVLGVTVGVVTSLILQKIYEISRNDSDENE